MNTNPSSATGGRNPRLRLAAAALAGLVALAVAYVVWDPDFTDWAPVRAQCLEGIAIDPRTEAVDAAIEACDRVIKSAQFAGTELAPLHAARAAMLHATGNRGRAVDDYQAAVEADPALTAAWRGIAEIRLSAGTPALAIEALDRAIDLAPQDAGLRALRGNALVGEMRHADALPDLIAAVEGSPDDPLLLGNLAVSQAAVGDYKSALVTADAALAIAPDGGAAPEAALQNRLLLAQLWQVRGTALLYFERDAEALESFQEAVARLPRAPLAQVGLVSAHCALGDAEAARAALDTAIADGAAPADGWHRLLVELGRLDEATVAESTPDALAPVAEQALQGWMADGCPLIFNPAQ